MRETQREGHKRASFFCDIACLLSNDLICYHVEVSKPHGLECRSLTSRRLFQNVFGISSSSRRNAVYCFIRLAFLFYRRLSSLKQSQSVSKSKLSFKVTKCKVGPCYNVKICFIKIPMFDYCVNIGFIITQVVPTLLKR